MRRGWAVTAALLVTGPLAAAEAQVSISNGVVRAGGVTVDSTGVHTPGAAVTRRGVVTRGGTRTGAAQTIVANGQHRAVDCGGGSLAIAGNANTVSVSNCTRVDVAGNHNQIVASFARDGAVSMPGNHNVLRWRAPAAIRVGVDDPGTGNRVIHEG